jgi:luciferase family oxidoreductase group 1
VGGGRFPDAENFPQQVWELVGHLDGTLPGDHPEKGVRLQPGGETAPEVWLLGSSDYSGLLAAQLGLRFAFAHFINPNGGDLVMHAYKERFKAAEKRDSAPHNLLCCFVICAPTDEEAEKRAAVVDLRRLEMAYNLDTPVPTLEQALEREYNEKEREYIRSQRARAVIGGPERCKARLLQLAEQYSADELMVLTITGDYESRKESYELLAETFTLPGR